jgi:hypothetical protein
VQRSELDDGYNAQGYIVDEEYIAWRGKATSWLFARCDADGDGYMSAPEMCTLAEAIGYAGGPLQWSVKYKELCADCGADPALGMTYAQLLHLICSG